MVGFDLAVEFGQRDAAHPLVLEAEALEHGHRRVGGQHLEEDELYVRQQQARVALRDQERPVSHDGVGGQRARVGDPRTGHRVDSEPGPRQLGEREPGDDLEGDVAPDGRVPQELDGALGDGRVAGHRVRDLAQCRGPVEQLGRDALVHLGDVAGRVVVAVEAAELDPGGGELLDGGMAGGANVPVRDVLERPARGREEEVRARRPEPHDDDAARHGYGAVGAGAVGVGDVGAGVVGWRGAPRGGSTVPRPSRTTHRPYRGSTSTLDRATSAFSRRWASGDC